MVLLCLGFAAAIVAASFTSRTGDVYVVIFVAAIALGAWHMLRSQPLPLSQRRRQTVITLAPVVVMFLLFQATTYLR